MAADEKTYLSREKLEELKQELEFLKTEKRKEVAESLEYARSLGDLSENAEYQEAGKLQAEVEDRIAAIESMLRRAVIVSDYKGKTVHIGSTIVVKKEGDHEERTYHIVGSEEANMAERKISNKSPLGEALLGKEKGDIFSFKTPNGEVTYKIIKIE